jgi:hypothetical protein
MVDPLFCSCRLILKGCREEQWDRNREIRLRHSQAVTVVTHLFATPQIKRHKDMAEGLRAPAAKPQVSPRGITCEQLIVLPLKEDDFNNENRNEEELEPDRHARRMQACGWR